MKKVLVLGSGFVARPLVRYLLEKAGAQLTVASNILEQAQKLINGHPLGTAQFLNVEDSESLRQAIAAHDVVVSLLPWTFHLKVARLCLELNKHLVTASYVKPEMKALDEQARARGLLFLNEMGVDPGIDHMAAMKIIDEVKQHGGKILSFYSYCGGLPSHESNNNPLGYKFSWSPTGVLLAALNDGRYLKDGKVVNVSSEQLFEHYWFLDIPGAGTFEAYVNRDALPYIELYGIQETRSMYRGTLRNVGHCESWNYFKKLGLLRQDLSFDFNQLTVKQAVAQLIGCSENDLLEEVANYLKIPTHSVTLKKLQWIGLFDDLKLSLGKATPFDMFAHLLQRKLNYAPGETDMLLQHHAFIAEYPDGRREEITSTMIDKGIPGGDSSMARTVGLPAAIATRLIVEEAIDLTGVQIPVSPKIYRPVLQELETMDIKLVERRRWLD